MIDSDEASFSELRDRFEKLQEKDRRRTLDRLSLLYCAENPSNTTAASQEAGAQAQATVTNVVVENSSDKKLPRFSGSDKLGQGEVSYRRWQRAANRLKDETATTEEQKKKAILRSLVGEADDIADLNRQKSVSQIIDILDKKYGNMIDGEDLLIEFYQIFQKEKQYASDYVSELYVELGDVVKYGGLTIDNLDKTLLKQFLRGCSDEELLTKLRLEDKVDSPPTFPDLIACIRREEARRTARRLRSRKQAKVHAVTLEQAESGVSGTELAQVQHRMAELEATASQVRSSPQPASQGSSQVEIQPELVQLQQRMAEVEKKLNTVRNTNVFCYRCGQDFHLATECENKPNKELVQQKVQLRKEKFAAKKA